MNIFEVLGSLKQQNNGVLQRASFLFYHFIIVVVLSLFTLLYLNLYKCNATATDSVVIVLRKPPPTPPQGPISKVDIICC